MKGLRLSNKSRLVIQFSMTFFFFLVELIVGYSSKSQALVADSFHMLSDVAALLVAFFSVQMSPKKWTKNTYGWARAEVLGAMVNSVFLVALCFTILVESIKRFIRKEDIENPEFVLVVGAIGLLVNIIGLIIFSQAPVEEGSHHGHSHGHHHHHSHLPRIKPKPSKKETAESNEPIAEESEDLSGEVSGATIDGEPSKSRTTVEKSPDSASQMNMHGVFLHLLGDALGSVIVIVSALVIWKTDWEYRMYLDPALSLVLVFILITSAWPLLKSSTMILLQTVPAHIQIDEMTKNLMEEIEGVIAVHDFHIWQLAGDRIVASAHIKCRNVKEYMRIAPKIKEFFHKEGIHSTTIQPEYTNLENQVGETKVYETAECVFVGHNDKIL